MTAVPDSAGLAGGPRVFGRFGWWTGLAPYGLILALRDSSLQEICALDVKLPKGFAASPDRSGDGESVPECFGVGNAGPSTKENRHEHDF
jgi:hypothetical protein